MVLPCVVRNIRGIQVTDDIIGRNLNKEEDKKNLVLQPAMEHVLDFLRPLVQEINFQSSHSEKVRYFASCESTACIWSSGLSQGHTCQPSQLKRNCSDF